MKKGLFSHLGSFLAIFIFLVTAAPAAPAVQAQVDPLVWADVSNGQQAHFLVILRHQATLPQVSTNTVSWQQQGQEVVNVLRQAAQSSQVGVLAELDKMGVSYRAYWIVNEIAVQGDQQVVAALAARPEVAYIEPDRAFHVALEPIGAQPAGVNAPLPVNGIEWNIARVNAPKLWAKGITGQGIVYANADTGVDWTHPALKAHYRGWDGTNADHNYNWWDAIHSAVIPGTSNSCGYNLQVPCDDYGHGTHTTGIGVGDDGTGNNKIGMAPGAKWIACRNMDYGTGRPSTYIECLQFFIAPTDLAGNNPNPDLRPDVISNSYGCPSTELCQPHSLQAAVNSVRAAGIFMSVSAGNDGSSLALGCSSINDPPALEASVFTVGSVDSYNTIAPDSSRGPVTVDGYNLLKPNLVAPGVDVRSSIPGGNYATWSGTSMAAPHIAGAVALLWSAYPTLRRNIKSTEALLEQSAVPHTSAQGCGGISHTAVPNNVYGYGRLNVLAAYNQFLPYNFYLAVIQR